MRTCRRRLRNAETSPEASPPRGSRVAGHLSRCGDAADGLGRAGPREVASIFRTAACGKRWRGKRITCAGRAARCGTSSCRRSCSSSALRFRFRLPAAGGVDKADARIFAHAVWRSLVLVLLGIFIMSNGAPRTDFNFINVLAQIGLGYWIVVLLAERALPRAGTGVHRDSGRLWILVLCVIRCRGRIVRLCIGRRAAGLASSGRHCRALGPQHESGGRVRPLVPEPVSAKRAVSISRRRRNDAQFHSVDRDDAARRAGRPTGFGASATKRERCAGCSSPAQRSWCCGIALDPAILPGVESTRWTICPIVKRLWTPSYVLYSGGWVMLVAAVLYWIIDVAACGGGHFRSSSSA